MTDVSPETVTKTMEAKEESSSSRLRDDFLTGMYGGTIALTRSIKEENVNQNQNMEELSSRRLAGLQSDPALRQTLSQEYSNFDEKTIGINERKSEYLEEATRKDFGILQQRENERYKTWEINNARFYTNAEVKMPTVKELGHELALNRVARMHPFVTEDPAGVYGQYNRIIDRYNGALSNAIEDAGSRSANTRKDVAGYLGAYAASAVANGLMDSTVFSTTEQSSLTAAVDVVSALGAAVFQRKLGFVGMIASQVIAHTTEKLAFENRTEQK